jgi:cytidine deaminase
VSRLSTLPKHRLEEISRRMPELVQSAQEARSLAYAPYSQYLVGAALLGADGNVYPGCNVENASYGLSICAERNAVFHMVASGCRSWVAVVVATEDGATPCGACLQVLHEFAEAWNCPVVAVNGRGRKKKYTLKALLPRAFEKKGSPNR